MRVAIIHYTAPSVAGGAESVIGQQADLLTTHGYDVTLVAGRGSCRNPAVHFHRVPILAATHPRQRALARALAGGKVTTVFDALRAEIRAQLESLLVKSDVVLVHNALTLHFNLPLTAALVDLAERALRDRVVAWTHDIAFINPLYQSELHAAFPWQLLGRPQAGIRYVTVSEARRKELMLMWRNNGVTREPPVVVIPNGIDALGSLAVPAALSALFHDTRLLERDPVMLAPVRITRRKNLELAIETLPLLMADELDPLLVVTGPVRGHHPARSRAYLEELRTLAGTRGVGERVVFLADRLGRALISREVSALYAAATLLLLSSESEGFGLPLLEAGLRRLPIVATDVPVFREIAGAQAAYFPPGEDPRVVAETIRQVACGEGLRRRVLREYSWDAVFLNRLSPFVSAIGKGEGSTA